MISIWCSSDQDERVAIAGKRSRVRSRSSKMRDQIRDYAFPPPDRLSSWEHIIGVTVSDTSMETAIEVVSTKANSWKMQPTTPPIEEDGNENRDQRKASHGEHQ